MKTIKRMCNLGEPILPGITFQAPGLTGFGAIEGDNIVIRIIKSGTVDRVDAYLGPYKIGTWHLTDIANVVAGDRVEIPVKQVALWLREAIAITQHLHTNLQSVHEEFQ